MSTSASRSALLAFAGTLSGLLVSTSVIAQSEPTPTGPYGAVMEYDPSMNPVQTIYRPRDLSTMRDIPIITWGNGGCQINGGAASRRFLMEVASYGYFIIAVGKPGPDRPVQPTADVIAPRERPAATNAAEGERTRGGGESAPGEPPEMSKVSDLAAGLDWAISENSRRGSIYHGKLAPNKVAVMGRSCGGMQTINMQSDPRIKTSIVWNAGTFTTPPPGILFPSGPNLLKAIRHPIAIIVGGPSDIAYAHAMEDVKRIEGVPLFFGSLPTGHGGTMGQANGGSTSRVAVAWLDWQLKGIKKASSMFVGADCTLCRDPNWTVIRKNL